MWVITKGFNNYNQHGDYFVAAYLEKPTREDLLELFYKGIKEKEITVYVEAFIIHILNGGGRIGSDDDWHYLTETSNGEIYK